MASMDSQRTARASSSSTRRPEPPPCPPSTRQRGQGMGASDQPVMTTSPPRNRQLARSRRCRGGAVYGPCKSRTWSSSLMRTQGQEGVVEGQTGIVGNRTNATVKEILALLGFAVGSVTVSRWRWHRREPDDGLAALDRYGVVVGVRRGLAALAVGGNAAVGRDAGGVGVLGSSTNGTRHGREDRRAGDVAA